MSDFNNNELNAMFSEAINRGGDSIEKTAEATGLYIQDRLRENSFAKQILPPQQVTTAELTRNVNDEGFSFIDDIEPDSIALEINMRGEPSKAYYQANRYAINFHTISSEELIKSESELRSYRMPLTKVIEQNVIKDIQERIDLSFMRHVRAGVQLATRARMNDLVDRGIVEHTFSNATTQGATADNKNFASPAQLASYLFTRNVNDTAATVGAQAGNLTTAGVYSDAGPENRVNGNYSNLLVSNEASFTRQYLTEAVKVQASRAQKAKVFLMHEFDWADTMAWLDTEAGLELTSEIVRDGYKYSTIGGMVFVTTVRDNPEILAPGQLYTFPAPEFLGRHLLLEGTKFFIDKRARFISMQAWEELGMGLGNVKGLGLNLMAGAQVDLFNEGLQTPDNASLNLTGTFTLTNDVNAPV